MCGFFFFFSSAVVVGGIDMMSQSLVLAKKPHVVIGECVGQLHPHHLENTKEFKVCVSQRLPVDYWTI